MRFVSVFTMELKARASRNSSRIQQKSLKKRSPKQTDPHVAKKLVSGPFLDPQNPPKITKNRSQNALEKKRQKKAMELNGTQRNSTRPTGSQAF